MLYQLSYFRTARYRVSRMIIGEVLTILKHPDHFGPARRRACGGVARNLRAVSSSFSRTYARASPARRARVTCPEAMSL